jgi:hypothetical protein
MKCVVCNEKVDRVFSQRILGKHNCEYLFCEDCGFLQTEEPYWLDEAYSSAISDADTGMLRRNIFMSQVLTSLIYMLYGKNVKCVDMAGGYGALTRLMRDVGFEYYWMDKYCLNIFAKGFEFPVGSRCDIVSAIEVLEHVHDPIEFLDNAIESTSANAVICTTELFEGRPPEPGSWWYYTFETGQHISFYQKKTLNLIAKKMGLFLHSNNGFHLFSKTEINPLIYKLTTSPRLAILMSDIVHRLMSSRTQLDHVKKLQN